jgi:TolA-binding protein
LIVLLLVVQGCQEDTAGIDKRVEAEKLFWKADRARRDLLAAGTLPSEELVGSVIQSYRVITSRYPIEEILSSQDLSERTAGHIAKLSAACHIAVGELLMSQERFEDARDEFVTLYGAADFDTTIKINAALYWARCEEALRRWDEAVSVYRSILDQYPYESLVPRNQSRIARLPLKIPALYLRAEQNQKATTAFQDARAYYQEIADATAGSLEHIGARMLVAESYAMEDNWRASAAEWESLIKVTEETPEAESLKPEIIFTLAQIKSQRLNEPRGAIQLLRSMEQERPDSSTANARLLMAQIFLNEGQTDSALTVLERSEKIGAPSKDIAAKSLYMKGQVHEALGNWELAVADYRNVSVRFPLTAWGLNAPVHIGTYYSRIGDQQSADKAFNDAVELYQNLLNTYREETRLAIEARSYLAECYARLGQWADAKEEFVYLAEKFPQTNAGMLALLRAAEIAELHLGSKDEAQRYLEQCIERYPDSPVAKRAQEELVRLGNE